MSHWFEMLLIHASLLLAEMIEFKPNRHGAMHSLVRYDMSRTDFAGSRIEQLPVALTGLRSLPDVARGPVAAIFNQVLNRTLTAIVSLDELERRASHSPPTGVTARSGARDDTATTLASAGRILSLHRESPSLGVTPPAVSAARGFMSRELYHLAIPNGLNDDLLTAGYAVPFMG